MLQNEKILLTVVIVQWILSKLLQALSVNRKIAGWKWTVTRLHRLCPGEKKKNYRSYWHICQYTFGFSWFWLNPWHLGVNFVSNCQVMVKDQKNTENILSVCTAVKGYLTHAHASVPKSTLHIEEVSSNNSNYYNNHKKKISSFKWPF